MSENIYCKNLKYVSIVMTYFDRVSQLNLTLQSFKQLGYTNFEVIIIDDGSVAEPIFESSFGDIGFPIKVIKMPSKKTYTNPSIPYNIGFELAKGEIIIIQNSECLHIDNIIDHARMYLHTNNYISYACVSLSKENTFDLIAKPEVNLPLIINSIKGNSNVSDIGQIVWKNHSKYRPNALHFTSAITKENLDKLSGFDKRYAIGTSFDDDEILKRIARIPLKIQIEDNVVVVHQWHPNVSSEINKFRLHYLHLRNQFLYKYVTLKETTYTVSESSMPYFLYKLYAPFIIYPLALVKSFLGTLNKWTKFQKF